MGKTKPAPRSIGGLAYIQTEAIQGIRPGRKKPLIDDRATSCAKQF